MNAKDSSSKGNVIEADSERWVRDWEGWNISTKGNSLIGNVVVEDSEQWIACWGKLEPEKDLE